MKNSKSTWKPDDSFHDLVDGEFKGVKRVNDALKANKIKLGNRIVTSREPEIIKLTEELRRTTLPQGFQQWQLPIVLGKGNRPVMSFITFGEPNAEIPNHKHKNDSLLRIVLSGAIIYKGQELTTGDWMYVPTGLPYSFKVGRFGCLLMHVYNGG
jgi:hypothetical protein